MKFSLKILQKLRPILEREVQISIFIEKSKFDLEPPQIFHQTSIGEKNFKFQHN